MKFGVRYFDPAIRMLDAIKHLPNKVTHYNTWFDDYALLRYHDYLIK